jgi:hypothetical protein
MARRLRSETTMTLEWIARKLAVGASGSAAQSLRDANAKKHSDLRGPTPIRASGANTIRESV